jgi:Rps23 Pro-64 3,4-dihydroxylase Tpa1-like proline 4-hydroxylase
LSRYIKKFGKVLSDELCDKLIKKFDQDKRVQNDPQPDYSTRTFIYASDKADWSSIMNEVAPIANQITEKYFRELGTLVEDWFDDGYVLAKYAEGDICALHDDSQCTEAPNNALRYATLLFYLNSTEDGETHFPNQAVKITPTKGHAVIFPAMLTHPHEVLSPRGDRYILQTWITDPNMIVNRADY